MKYGRRDVRCSGAVELVVFAGGERKWGCRVLGKPEVTKAAPTYYVDEGGIVTVGLHAPRTKGGFRMLKTKVAEILEGGGRFATRGIVCIQFQLILDRASGKVMPDYVHRARISS